jgi:glutathione S-transferase
MITFYGVSISVHVRKAVVTAIAKGINYKLEPVLPRNPPPNWLSLSPTGQVPAMQDGDFTLSESSAICLYLERKQKEPSILPVADKEYARALFFDGYAGWMARSLIQGLVFQKVINPIMLKGTTDQSVVDHLLADVQPKIFGYLESQIDGKFLVGSALSLADIAVVSNLINYLYLDFSIESSKYPKLKRYCETMIRLEPFRQALVREAPAAEQLVLSRTFLS